MPEEEAFAVLVSIMQDYTMREMYKPDMFYLGQCIYQLESLVQVDPLDSICLRTMMMIFLPFGRNAFRISIGTFKRRTFARRCTRPAGFSRCSRRNSPWQWSTE